MKKMAVFSCPGLGDGLISLQLAYNLSLNGYQVDLFHDQNFYQLQSWTNVLIQKYPDFFDIEQLFREYEKVFVSQDLENLYVQALIFEGKRKYPKRLFVLNPSPSKKVGTQAFYKDTYFRPDICMAKNIELFSKNILKLKKTTAQSPLQLSRFQNQSLADTLFSLKKEKLKKQEENHQKKIALENKKRKIVIHPVASRISKSWKKTKFLKLATLLEKQSFEVFFVMTKKEKARFVWKEAADKIKIFPTLHELALFLTNAAVFVGGDSGVGHLASALHIPTISIFRSYRTALLWRPGWGNNQIIFPSHLIPNVSGFRLRDQKWASFISVKKVEKTILQSLEVK